MTWPAGSSNRPRSAVRWPDSRRRSTTATGCPCGCVNWPGSSSRTTTSARSASTPATPTDPRPESTRSSTRTPWNGGRGQASPIRNASPRNSRTGSPPSTPNSVTTRTSGSAAASTSPTSCSPTWRCPVRCGSAWAVRCAPSTSGRAARSPCPAAPAGASGSRHFVGLDGSQRAPRISRPGRAPVSAPCRRVTTPLTTVAS